MCFSAAGKFCAECSASEMFPAVRASRRMRSGIVRLRSGQHPPLFVRARKDPGTFGDVYLAYHDQVLRYLVRQTFDPEVAFDLMAETFAEMLAGIAGFRGATEDEGRQWMWTIARHQLYRWRERGRVERRHLQ